MKILGKFLQGFSALAFAWVLFIPLIVNPHKGFIDKTGDCWYGDDFVFSAAILETEVTGCSSNLRMLSQFAGDEHRIAFLSSSGYARSWVSHQAKAHSRELHIADPPAIGGSCTAE